jgi:UDP-GlcNAc:undecaprenyl-phosphate GlcNAc-1-phosphate transferase
MAGAIIVFFVSLVLSIIAVAVVLHLSHKKSWYDQINERKIHSGNIPRLGGIGFATTFIVVAFCVNFFFQETGFGLRFLPVLLGTLLIFISGVYDDFRPMAPRYKLAIQIIAALGVVIPGYTFHGFFFFDLVFFSRFDFLRFPLTLLWIVGLTNAINFIDGIDGLAGGLCALAALTFAVIAFSFSAYDFTSFFCICLTGVIIGFLFFNAPFPRARIFMGDGGSQFLGFTLALLPLIERQNSPAALPVFYAAALLAIPIFDTIAAVWRRLRDGRRIDSPDKLHIHHKLLNLNLNARGVDMILWSLQVVLGILVYLSLRVTGWFSLAILGTSYLVVIAFFTVIHYMNRRALASSLAREIPKEKAAGK